ncbi:MAG TPA: hypothetical protein VLJ76_11220 [Gaiellaceae bacterium]|nr:hypothetical protein [Gaiellaceae bacterium]
MPASDLSENTQSITLTIPGDRRYVEIVRLFVGGVAARLGLPYETMDDLQLALESVLLKAELGPELTLEASVRDDAVSIELGPFARDPLARDSERPEGLVLERLLAALVGGAESTSKDDGAWLRLDARLPAGNAPA